MTLELLAMLAAVLSRYRASQDACDASIPFGGINIIMLGDFHQFPPVKAANCALYCQVGISELGAVGKNLYDQFKTVVELKQQMRMKDEVWIALLERLREGECGEEDLKLVRKLLLTEEGCDILDFSKLPWSDVVLVTPRHGARIQWNFASLAKHCAWTGERLYISMAEDTVGKDRRMPSLAQRIQIAGMKPDHTAKLDGEVELAVGMKVMVLTNISAKGELANGTRGTIEDIILDVRDWDTSMDEPTGTTKLKYPPAMVLFKPSKPTRMHFEGIAPGLIPLFPSEETFSIKDSQNRSKTIRRRQFPLTAAYAFTDYKAQGQTIEHVIVDLARPPFGELTPFNAYVALSRSRGRDNIRLLRDFDTTLFTTHPSEDLRVEDARLTLLDRETEIRRLEEFVLW